MLVLCYISGNIGHVIIDSCLVVPKVRFPIEVSHPTSRYFGRCCAFIKSVSGLFAPNPGRVLHKYLVSPNPMSYACETHTDKKGQVYSRTAICIQGVPPLDCPQLGSWSQFGLTQFVNTCVQSASLIG